tara:strand:- start:3640 stop:3921 length:282 start_codon:yes stop_codon:yes gene_type:complete
MKKWIHDGFRCPQSGCDGTVGIWPISARNPIVEAPADADGDYIVGAWVCSSPQRHQGWIAQDEIEGWQPTSPTKGEPPPTGQIDLWRVFDADV